MPGQLIAGFSEADNQAVGASRADVFEERVCLGYECSAVLGYAI